MRVAADVERVSASLSKAARMGMAGFLLWSADSIMRLRFALGSEHSGLFYGELQQHWNSRCPVLVQS